MGMTKEEKQFAIAEARGWTKCRLAILDAGGGTRTPTAHGFPPGRNYEAPCSDYHRDLNATISLCNFLAEKGWRCEIANGLDKTWECTFWRAESPYTIHENVGERDGSKTEEHYGCADSLAEAISEAFLRAIGKWQD